MNPNFRVPGHLETIPEEVSLEFKPIVCPVALKGILVLDIGTENKPSEKAALAKLYFVCGAAFHKAMVLKCEHALQPLGGLVQQRMSPLQSLCFSRMGWAENAHLSQVPRRWC